MGIDLTMKTCREHNINSAACHLVTWIFTLPRYTYIGITQKIYMRKNDKCLLVSGIWCLTVGSGKLTRR
jgi:hypothetical protein